MMDIVDDVLFLTKHGNEAAYVCRNKEEGYIYIIHQWKDSESVLRSQFFMPSEDILEDLVFYFYEDWQKL